VIGHLIGAPLAKLVGRDPVVGGVLVAIDVLVEVEQDGRLTLEDTLALVERDLLVVTLGFRSSFDVTRSNLDAIERVLEGRRSSSIRPDRRSGARRAGARGA
jgi:hypothetical protein